MFAQHPAGLRTLFFTELWECFSYYGMRALLMLYLVDALQYQRADALAVYATYTALVYITPLIGGYLAICLVISRLLPPKTGTIPGQSRQPGSQNSSSSTGNFLGLGFASTKPVNLAPIFS